MKILLFITYLLVATISHSQYLYEPTEKYPYGQLNPEAPKETADFAPLIGTCRCKSVARLDPNTWADTVMMDWTYKYIMNGMAVQDQTLKEDGSHSGSIRQYNADSARWFVHYYASATPTPVLSAWEGNVNEKGDIVLYKDQTAPNGMKGFYKITFSEITALGFNWTGAWVNKSETIIYPTWRIFCVKNM